MNYYERIQQSIDFIEEKLCEDIALEDCSNRAYMSVSGYYRIFFSITGMNVKEYIRSRRLTCALEELAQGINVLDIAVKYGYQSSDGFSRSFKKQFGKLPSEIKTESLQNMSNTLERIDIMETLFDNNGSMEQYPEIKVIKELPPMKVACFSYFGKYPEDYAFKMLKEWYMENEISLHESAYRLFGYNNPDPKEGQEEYAYEYCITIPDDLYEMLEDVPVEMKEITYPKVYRKKLTGGKYAVMSVKRNGNELGEEIKKAWPRFLNWLNESKFIWGTKQYLEEHIGFSEEDDHIGGVELYISIAEDKENRSNQIKEITKKEEKLIIFREEGMDFQTVNNQCWNRAMTWVKKMGMDSDRCSVYQYNQGFEHPKVLFNVVMIGVPTDTEIKEPIAGEYMIETLKEGKYVSLSATWGEEEGIVWESIGKWCRKNKIKKSKRQWLEEVEHKDWVISGKITCLLPVD